MIYLLTMGWFLAHTSLAMTTKHSATSGENLFLQEQDTQGAGASYCPKLQCGRVCRHISGEAGADGSLAQLARGEGLLTQESVESWQLGTGTHSQPLECM